MSDANAFSVNVHLASGRLVAELMLGDDQTILEVKQRLEEVNGMPLRAQQLIFMEQILADSMTVKLAGICRGASLLLVRTTREQIQSITDLRAAFPSMRSIGVQTSEGLEEDPPLLDFESMMLDRHP